LLSEDGGSGYAEKERAGRPFPDPKASRRIASIRENPDHKKWGVFMDVLEHAAYCNRIREADGEGFLFDQTVLPGESECDEDAFANGYLTEDEMYFPDDYKPAPYIPNSVKQRIYYLFTTKSWDVKRLAERFNMRTERVSAIINLKATEPAMKAQGCYREEADQLLTALYSGKYKSQEKEPSYDLGVNVDMMHDDQLPQDVFPRVPSTLQGRIVRMPITLQKIPQPPFSERKHRSKYVLKDISGARTKPSPAVLVDYDGKRRQCTKKEEAYRSWAHKRYTVKPGTVPGTLVQPDAYAEK